MKPHTIAEELLFPASKYFVRVLIGREFVNKLNSKYISNDREHRKIADTSADILDQIMQEMESCPFPIFSIKLEESTDIAYCSKLMVKMMLKLCQDIGLDFKVW
ncbi:Protein ZBED8 [Thelohanellus kitauei]|uniref:Protein ZBED8 n=1 Tax=Thelohanellus kitauei TaxID=669202 RepID=A0A0C2JL02_THEKT|nr:Protein ZBED8 [Thelohanellus kitauei]